MYLNSDDLLLDDLTLDELKNDAETFLLSKGIGTVDRNGRLKPFYVTLFPTSFDPITYNKLSELQAPMNSMVWRISRDHQFLEDSLKSLTCPFFQNLYSIYDHVHREGYAAKHQLCLSRSDYMLDQNTNSRQIEINTIAVSFFGIADKISLFHRYMVDRYGYFFGENHRCLVPDQPNESFATALMKAHFLANSPSLKSILFVVKDDEENLVDQKLIEWKILESQLDISIYRRSFKKLDGQISLGPNKELLIKARGMNKEISVVYFRTGYVPEQYDGERDWSIRLLIEQSTAVKCPSIQFQLAGLKKFQFLMATNENILEKYVNSSNLKKIQSVFAKFWDVNDETRPIVCAKPKNFVLKSNLEGGGNNVFGEDIKSKIDEIIANKQNSNWFLMEKINPKPVQSAVLTNNGIIYGKIHSEIGCFGSILAGDTIESNNYCGNLLRSKYDHVNETGIISSGGILDSICLDPPVLY